MLKDLLKRMAFQDLTEMSDCTGISTGSLKDIMDGRNKYPKLRTVMLIFDYCNRREGGVRHLEDVAKPQYAEVVGRAMKITPDSWYDCVQMIYEVGDYIDWEDGAPIQKLKWVEFTDVLGLEDDDLVWRGGSRELSFGMYILKIAGRILIVSEEDLKSPIVPLDSPSA